MPGIDLTIRMANLQNAVDRLSVLRERYRNLSADIEVLRQRQLGLANSTTSLKNQIDNLDKESNDYQKTSKRLEQQQKKEQTQLQRVTKLIRDKTTQQNALNVSMSQAENSTKRATAQIQKMGFAAKTATTLVNQLRFALVGTFGVFAAIQVFKNLAREAIAFEDAMRQVKVVTGAGKDEIMQLRNAALDLAASGIFNPSEVAAIQVNLSKLGFTVKEISYMVKSIGDISIVTGEDLEKSTSLLATTIRSFGLDAAATKTIANQMALAFNKSALGVSNMYEALKYVGPPAAQLGWTFAEVSSVLGILADNMISGSLAGTSLRNMMLEWSDANSSLRKTTNAVGYSFDEFIEKIGTLRDISTDGALKTIGLRRAVTAFISVARNSDRIKALNGELEKQVDIIDEMASDRLLTVRQQWDALGSSINAVTSSIGNSIGGFARLLKSVDGVIDDFYVLNKYADEIRELAGGDVLMKLGSLWPPMMQRYIDYANQRQKAEDAAIERERQYQEMLGNRVRQLLATVNTVKQYEALMDGLYSQALSMRTSPLMISPDMMQKYKELIDLMTMLNEKYKERAELQAAEDDMAAKTLLGLEERIEIELARAKFVGFELDRQLELIRNKYQRLNNDLIEDQKEHDLAVRLEAITHSNKMEELQRKEDKRVADALKSLGDANKIKQQITAIQAEMEQAIIAGEPDRVAELSMRLNELQQMFDRIAKATEAYIYASKSRSEQIKIEAKETMKLREEASKGWTPKKLAGDFEEDGEDGYVNSLKSLMTEAAQQANSLADDMVAAIDRVVDRYDRMVSDIQHALDRETELMAEGYANNVSMKQQELSRIQALRADALADQERYLAQQRVIESISQGLNIASAISSIIKDSFKNAGIWGTLVAPAVIGAMFSLWRANKVKAVESGYTYGEGGRVTGYIEGKPHSKGGKWINVEGKEYVINTDGVNRETLPMLDYINKYGRVNWEYIGGIENKGVSIVSLDEGKTIKSIHSLLQKMGTDSAQVEYHNGFKIHKSGSRIRKVYVN